MTVSEGFADTALRACATCGGQRVFETTLCVDGHGADCPERACVACGEAVLVGTFDFELAVGTVSAPRVAAAA